MVFRAFVLYMFIAFDVVQEKRVKGKGKKWSENKASGNCYIIFQKCWRKKLRCILQAFVLLFYVFISVDINEEKKDKGRGGNQKTKHMLLLNKFSVILDGKKEKFAYVMIFISSERIIMRITDVEDKVLVHS